MLLATYRKGRLLKLYNILEMARLQAQQNDQLLGKGSDK